MATPLVWLRAIDYSGTGAWLDKTANGNNATFATGVNAKNTAGNGIILNGSTYWTLPSMVVGNAWTASVWYKQTANPSTLNGSIISANQFAGINLAISQTAANTYQGYFFNSTYSQYPYSTAVTATNGIWANIQITWNGSSMLAYLNGTLMGTTTSTAVANNAATTFNIGKNHNPYQVYVTGEIGELRIYNTAITQAQVTADYGSSMGIYMLAPLVLLRGVNYTGGSSWTDDSGSGKTATLEGGTAAINTANNAIVLNGSTSWVFPDVGLGNAYTASMWIKPTSMSSSTWAADNCLLTQQFNVPAGTRIVSLSLVVAANATTSSANIAARVWVPNNYQNTPVAISNNTWVHIIVTWDGTNMITYLNGTQASSSVLTVSVASGNMPWRIGRRWDSANYITGEVSEVSLYNAPMSPAQVSAMYSRGINDITPTAPPAITGIAFTSVSQTSFVARWAGGYGATSCTYTLDGTAVTPSSQNPYLQTATFTGLSAGTTYALIVTATNATGTVASSAASVTTQSPSPTTPVVTVGSVASTSFVASWTGGLYATSYTYKLNTVTVTPSTDSVSGKTATFTGLSASTTYNLVVTATNTSGSAASTSVAVTTTVPPPVAAVVTISSITPTSFVASWTGGTNATSYTYTIDGLAVTPSTDNGLTSKTATFTGLTPSTTYSLVVNPTNAGGPTPTTKSITTLIPYPTVPVVTVNSVGDTTFSVSYSSTGTSYSYTLNGASATPSVSGSTATFSDLTGLTAYSLIVTATNTTGSTPSATTSVTTLISPPSTPVVSISSVTDTSFIANWTGALRVTSYTYTLNGSSATPSTDNGLASKSATFTGLAASTSYTLVVTATNSTNSTNSVGTTITTLIPPPTIPVVTVTPRDVSATVSWTGGATATSYSYFVTSNGITITPTIVDHGVSGQTATITGLTATTNYNITVGATNGTGSTASVGTSFTTLIAAPTAPVVTIGSIRDTSFVATWTGGVGATSYTYTLNGNATTPSVDAGLSSKTATFTGLTGSTTYALIVTAVNATNPTSSASTSMTTLIPPPTTPSGLTLSSITDTSFVASWTGGDPATSYTYTLDGTATTPATDDIVNDTATFTGLTANTTYILIVTAVGSTGPTSSAPISVTTAPPRPSAAIITANLVRDTSFSISWTGANGATSYTYKLNGTTVTPSVDRGTLDKTATFTGLTASTTYAVILVATNGTGSKNSTVTVETSGPPPTTPVVTVSSITDVSFTANWTGVGATSYSYSLNGQAAIPSTDNGVASRSATFTGLLPSNTYSLIVIATNTTGSTYSLASSFTTMPPAPTLPVVTVSRITALTFMASWTGALGASSYTFTLNGSAVTPSINNKTATFTGLLPNTLYSVVVTAVNPTAPTSAAAVSVRTLTSPTKPTELTASITSSSFMVSWTGGSDVTSYSYLLNSILFTPVDNGLVGQTATFLGLSELSDYTCTVIAQNSYGSAASEILNIRTLKTPPLTTPYTVVKTQQSLSDIVSPAAASTAIQDALSANVAPATVATAAMAVGTPTMFTALVNNPNFIGTSVAIPAFAATILYNSFAEVTTLDTTLPLNVNFPAIDGSVAAPAANNNTKLAIDLTVDRFVPLTGATGYGINVVGGVQYFVTPTDPSGTLINVGDVLTFTTNAGANLSFTVADLDIVFIPYTAPPSIICFLGSAPVLTPTGYCRIDKLVVGDIVKTPTGTAVIEAIKKQVCEPSADSNPYVIPEGVFGANRRLLISPRHKVSVSGHMFEARQLGLQQEEQPKAFTYYNLQITDTANMIVAGVEVESLKPLVRVTVTREAFERMLPKFGGLTREVKAKCRFLPDGSVSVLSVPRLL